VISSDRDVSDLVRLHLVAAGLKVSVAADARTGLEKAAKRPYDLVVVDERLGGCDGGRVCAALRSERHEVYLPVLALSTRTADRDAIAALEAGADDYMRMPLRFTELVARARMLITRARRPVERPPGRLLAAGPIVLDLERQEVRVANGLVAVTLGEFRILAALMARPGLVLTRERLLKSLGDSAAELGVRNVDVRIAALRRKLGIGAAVIRTVKGVGYFCSRS
jgi:DNA-binding response OmpR family regulator